MLAVYRAAAPRPCILNALSVNPLMRVSRYLALGLFLAAAPAFVACSGDEASSASPPAGGGRGRGGAPAPVPVTVASVVQKSMPLEIRVIASAEADSTVAVRSQLTG